jgi:hypothetical protein
MALNNLACATSSRGPFRSWVRVQIALWHSFIAAGGMKVFAYEKYRTMSEKNGPSGLNHGLVTFIGLCEIAGAVGIVLPMAVNVAPWLSPAPHRAVDLSPILARYSGPLPDASRCGRVA